MRTLFLPTLRGYGTLADLHIAMSLDEDLLYLVEDFMMEFSFDLFDPTNAVDDAVTDILYRWAGVDTVNPTSRGSQVDAQKLEFLEEFFGKEFVSLYGGPNPGTTAGNLIEESFQIVLDNIKAHLLLQVGAAQLFADTVSYNPYTGEPEASAALSQSAIIDLESYATAPGVDPEAYWVQVAKFIDATKGFANLTSTENGWMNTSIVATNSGLSWTAIKALTSPTNEGPDIVGTSSGETLNGTAQNEDIYGNNGNDTLHGNAGHDTLNGGSGDDTLYGGTGNDYLAGGANNDTLEGGAGGDIAEGGDGNDTYIYTSGDDVYYDTSGTNTVTLPVGITLSDVSVYRVDNDTQNIRSIFISVDDLGIIEFKELVYTNGSINNWFQSIVFADTSTLILRNITSLTTYGGEGNDTIFAVYGANAINDTIYGLNGDDDLRGDAGNDTLDGGIGNDLLQGGADNDTYIASAGFDVIAESGGTDTIILPANVSTGDLHLVRLNSSANDLQIMVDGLGQILVDNQFLSAGYRIESIQLASGTLDLTTLSIETIGGIGADLMYGIDSGASTNDIFDGREGNDTMQGGAGNDIYYFSQGQDVVAESTGSSNDGIKFREGVLVSDISIYRGGLQGRDLFLVDQNGNTLKVSNHFLNTQYHVEYAQFYDSTLWTFSSMEIEAHGTAGADDLFAYDIGDASNADTVYGYAGNDDLRGGYGDDFIDGGDGDDYVDGGEGADILYGGNNNDTISGGGGNDAIYGGAGNDTISSGAGDDVIETGAGDDSVNGGGGSGGIDTITYANASGAVTVSLAITSAQNTGGDGTDTISYVENLIGSTYGDTLTGNTDANTIRGGAGNDTISASNGNDILYGDGGADTLTGGANADTFVFEAATAFGASDTITDFSTAQSDKLNIADLLDGYDPLTDLISDFVRITDNGTHSFLSVDADGGANGFTQIAQLSSVTTIAAGATATEAELQTLITNGQLIAA